MATSKKNSGTRGKSTAKSTANRKKAASKSASASHSAQSLTTTDHKKIQSWAEERGAHPACVKGTGDKNDIGLLRLDFPGYSEENLEPIGWEDFFEKFEERGLALLYQEQTAGGDRSNFNKLISRETAEEKPKTRTAR